VRDVHKQTVVACVRVAAASTARHEVRTFATTAAGLRVLLGWRVAAGCTHAVLESTGEYWKPVWHRLEDRLTLVLANATAVRNLPGRESDVTTRSGSPICSSMGWCGAAWCRPRRFRRCAS
jgi:hypothetical protein